MNSGQLMGNLARDPEIRFTKTGKAVAMFTVACSRTYIPAGSTEQRELTDFIPCVAWGNLAESVGNNLAKGRRVFVEAVFPYVLMKVRMARNVIARKSSPIL